MRRPRQPARQLQGGSAERQGRSEVERHRERHDGGEAEMDGQQRRQDGRDHRGAAVDAPGPGHEIRAVARDRAMPSGNGMPMQQASGAIRASEIGDLGRDPGSAISASKSGGSSTR